MGRIVPLLLLALLGSPMRSSAQFWDFVYVLLNGDSTTWPNYDTAYITSFRDDVTISLVAAQHGSVFELERKDGGRLRYTTNSPAQYGFGFDHRWLSFEVTFTIPGMGLVNEDKGETTASGLGFSLNGRKWWFRNFFRTTQGFHATDPELVLPGASEDTPGVYRDDVRNFTYMASLNRGFNPRRFSYNAANWQMERQERSAGCWIAGATVWYTESTWDHPVVPGFDRESYTAPYDLNSGRRWILGITGGYTYTFTLWRRGFFNLLFVPGIASQQQRLATASGDAESGWNVAATAEVRAGLGYVGDRWYAALTMNSYQNTGAIPPDLTIGSAFMNGHLGVGWRFHKEKPIWRKVGL